MITARASGTGRAAEMWLHTAAHSMSRSAHHNAKAEMPTPRIAGQRGRRPGGRELMAGVHGEGHEVEQLLKQRLELVE